MKISHVIGAAGLSLALGLTGCGEANSATEMDTAEEMSVQRTNPDAEILHAVAGFTDYNVQPSVSAVAERAQFVVLGKVVAWHDGPVHDLGGMALTYAVMETETEQTFKAADGESSRRYTLVFTGALPVDEHGDFVPLESEETRYTALSIDDVREAVPEGSRVIVLADEFEAEAGADGEAFLQVLRDWTVPGGGPLLYPHSQGLLFETSEGGYESGGRAEQEDISFEQWPTSKDYRGSTQDGTFAALIADLSK